MSFRPDQESMCLTAETILPQVGHFVNRLCYNIYMKENVSVHQWPALEQWLLEQLQRCNQTPREASIGADVGHGAISKYLNGGRPDPERCIKLAVYFEVPREWVLSLAGYFDLPPGYDKFVTEIGKIAESLSDDDKELLLDQARNLDRRRKRG